MEPTQNQTNNTNPNQPVPAVSEEMVNTPIVEIKKDILMGVLCYLGPLVIVPYMSALDNPFVKFHVRQGIVLFGLWFTLYTILSIFLFGGFYLIIMFLNLGLVILAIIGIMNVIKEKEVELPLIGELGNKIKI